MIKTIIKLITILLLSSNCVANQIDLFSTSTNKLTVTYGVGALNTKSQEIVYLEPSSDKKLSKLDWKAQGAPIYAVDLSFIYPKWVNLNLNTWSLLTKSNGLMDDYDWLNPTSRKWTHWSHHQNTTLQKAAGVDLNLDKPFFLNRNFTLAPALGVHMNTFNFMAKGGVANYLDQTMIFPKNQKVIQYQQTFTAPYLGANASYSYNEFSLNTSFKFSNKTFSEDLDTHYLRYTDFETSTEKSLFYSLTLNGNYQISNKMHFYLNTEFTKYATARGDLYIEDHYNSWIGYLDKTAGLNNRQLILSTGFVLTT